MDFTKVMMGLSRKRVEYDFAVDVFSFGCVLWEILVGSELYQSFSTAKQVQQLVLSGFFSFSFCC